MNINPSGCINLCSRWPTGSLHGYFVMHFGGKVNPTEEFLEKVQLPHPGQTDQRRGVGNDFHKPSRVAVSRSSRQSASV